MSQMVLAFAPRRPAPAARAAPPTPAASPRLTLTPLAPSGTVIAVVTQFADMREEREDGLVKLALSPERLADADLRRMLGEEADRAGDIAVLWDEREAQLVHVYDAALSRNPARTPGYADLKLRADRAPRYAALHAAA